MIKVCPNGDSFANAIIDSYPPNVARRGTMDDMSCSEDHVVAMRRYFRDGHRDPEALRGFDPPVHLVGWVLPSPFVGTVPLGVRLGSRDDR
jgi:hypothetical protein